MEEIKVENDMLLILSRKKYAVRRNKKFNPLKNIN